MSELEDRLQAVMNDPEELARITRLASQIMGNMGGNTDAAPEPSSPAPKGLAGLFSGDGAVRGGSRGVLEALMPLIDPLRAAKLSRALRMAGMARLAVRALAESGGEHGL